MDMRISGSGQIAAGEYDNIRISGSGRCSGLVRCASFHASGSASGETLECKNELKVSGSCGFDKDVRCGSLGVSGAFSCGGNLTAEQKVHCSGGAKVTGTVKCSELQVSGGITAGGDIEAETVKVSGKINCGGLLNAEEINICSSGNMEIGTIGGSKVVATRDYLKDTRTTDEGVTSTGLPRSNVLYYELDGGAWVCVRPSGTEPKIKIYINAVSDDPEKTRALLDAYARDMDRILGL